MESFLNDNYLLNTDTAKFLYSSVRSLPMIGVTPILSDMIRSFDRPYSNISEILIHGNESFKRALMCAGADEMYIKGEASDYEVFAEFAKICPLLVGSMLYLEVHLLLRKIFDIRLPINEKNIDSIWCTTAEYLIKNSITPRKIFQILKVESIYTEFSPYETFDIPDDGVFVPILSLDSIIHCHSRGYRNRIEMLSKASGINICDLKSLRDAVISQIDEFYSLGGRSLSVTLSDFQRFVCPDPYHADEIFHEALKKDGDIKPHEKAKLFLAELLRTVSTECVSRKMTLHLSLDCVNYHALKELLSFISAKSKLPETVMISRDMRELSRLPSEFYGVRLTLPADSKTEISRAVGSISANSALGHTLGYASDTASILSLFGNDICRRLLSEILSEELSFGVISDISTASDIIKNISYYNIKSHMEKKT